MVFKLSTGTCKYFTRHMQAVEKKTHELEEKERILSKKLHNTTSTI